MHHFLFRCLGSAIRRLACIEEVLSWVLKVDGGFPQFTGPVRSCVPPHFATAEDFRIFLPKYLDRTFKQTMAASYPHILQFSSFGSTETLQLVQYSEISYGPIEIITQFLLFSRLHISSSYLAVNSSMAEFQHLRNNSIQFRVTGSWKWKEVYVHPGPLQTLHIQDFCNFTVTPRAVLFWLLHGFEYN
jgi:hypothetical protein